MTIETNENLLSRMGERVARLEANQEALKNDTESIRSSIHLFNNEIQKIVISQERGLMAMTGLASDVSKILASAPSIERAIQAFEAMRDDLHGLIEDRHRRSGERGAVGILTAFLRGVLPWIIAVAALGVWATSHVTIKP